MAKNDSPIRHIHNPPPGEIPDDAPSGHARAEFAKRLQHLMAKKGWSQADLSREASKFMPGKKEIGRVPEDLVLDVRVDAVDDELG